MEMFFDISFGIALQEECLPLVKAVADTLQACAFIDPKRADMFWWKSRASAFILSSKESVLVKFQWDGEDFALFRFFEKENLFLHNMYTAERGEFEIMTPGATRQLSEFLKSKADHFSDLVLQIACVKN